MSYKDFVKANLSGVMAAQIGKKNPREAMKVVAKLWRQENPGAGSSKARKSPKKVGCSAKFIAKCAAKSPARLCRVGAKGRRSCALPIGVRLPAGHKYTGRPKGSKSKKSRSPLGVSMSFRSPMRMHSPVMHSPVMRMRSPLMRFW